MSLAIIAEMPEAATASMMARIRSMSSSYMMVLTVRYDFTPARVHSPAMRRRSSRVKFTLERERMLSPSTPKYTASAPALMADRRLS